MVKMWWTIQIDLNKDLNPGSSQKPYTLSDSLPKNWKNLEVQKHFNDNWMAFEKKRLVAADDLYP